MNIEELLDDLKVSYRRSGEHHHTRPGWIQIERCPFCESSNFHLGFNLTSQHFNCWKCGGHYGPKVLEALGVPREKARNFIRALDTSTVVPRERSRVSLLEPKGKGPLLAAHARYLESRGFDPEELQRIWKVEGIGLAAKLAWRIYIPIIHHNVRVSWTTRAIGGRVVQRYVSASAEEEAENHKYLIYGGDFCYHSIVVAEGPLDAWKIGPGAGAVFGTAFSTAQVKHLAKIPKRFICFDSSPDAQRVARELADQLSCFPGTTENLLIDAKDPGCASPREISLIRRVAKL